MRYYFSPIVNGEIGKEEGFYDTKSKESTLPEEITSQIESFRKTGFDTVTGGKEKDENGNIINYTKDIRVNDKNIHEFMDLVQFPSHDPSCHYFSVLVIR